MEYRTILKGAEIVNKEIKECALWFAMLTIRNTCEACCNCNYCPFGCICYIAGAEDFCPIADMDNEYIEKAVNEYMGVVKHE